MDRNINNEIMEIAPFYTRPQDGFIDAGSDSGIGWPLVDGYFTPPEEIERIGDVSNDLLTTVG